jgi:hypothetical protein
MEFAYFRFAYFRFAYFGSFQYISKEITRIFPVLPNKRVPTLNSAARWELAIAIPHFGCCWFGLVCTMAAVVPTAEDILTRGLLTAGFSQDRLDGRRAETKEERFVANYGVTATTVRTVLVDLATAAIAAARIDNPNLGHLLMTLHWLKNALSQSVMAGLFDLDEKTVRKWVWIYVCAIQALKGQKIIWPWDTVHSDTIIIVSVDGVHCRIREPREQPDARWYSHKFHKPGVAYELGISMEESRLVWIKGPYFAATHDVTILRQPNGLKAKMENNHPGERLLTDRGYSGEPLLCAVRNRFDTPDVTEFKRRG